MKRWLSIRRLSWAAIALAAAFVIGAGSWIWWVKAERKRTEALLQSTVIDGFVADNIPLDEAFERLVSMLKDADPRFRNFTVNWDPLLKFSRQYQDPSITEPQIMKEMTWIMLDLRDAKNVTPIEIGSYLCRLSNLRYEIDPNEFAIAPLHTSGRRPLEAAWDQVWSKITSAWEYAFQSSTP